MPKLDPIFRGETIVCIGGGPSLTREDVDFVRGKARVLAINNAYELAPWADVLYACDGRWWRHHWARVKDLPALKVSLQLPADKKPDGVLCLKKTGRGGLEPDPSGLRHGHNSGYQALGVCAHLGVSRILLLGYDMRLGTGGRAHWHPDHPWRMHPSFNTWIALYQTLVEPLKARGIQVINCTRESNLTAFPRGDLRALLTRREAAA